MTPGSAGAGFGFWLTGKLSRAWVGFIGGAWHLVVVKLGRALDAAWCGAWHGALGWVVVVVMLNCHILLKP